jgi:hypothetical protein
MFSHLTCWWCNKKLMAVSHAIATTRDGHSVKVHYACLADTQKQEGTGTVIATDSVPVHGIDQE